MTRPTLTLKKPVTTKTEEIAEEVIASNRKSVQVVTKIIKAPPKDEAGHKEEPTEEALKESETDQSTSDDSAPKKSKKEKPKKEPAPVPPLVLKLCEKFPNLFNLEDRKPLKTGIHEDILKEMADDPDATPEDVGRALHYYVKGKSYQESFKKHQHSFDLNGEIAGEAKDVTARVPAILLKLCEKYPNAFNLKLRNPLKVGIEKDILEEMKDDVEVTWQSLKGSLMYYMRSKGYQIGLAKQEHRIDLNGEIAGQVTDVNKFEERYFKKEPRRKLPHDSAPKKPLEPHPNTPPLLLKLYERFPNVFTLSFMKPLKIGISQDIIESMADDSDVTQETLSEALAYYTKGTGYLFGIAKNPNRFNLQGEVAGQVTVNQKTFAEMEIKRRLLRKAEAHQKAISEPSNETIES